MTLKELFEKYDNAEDYIIEILDKNISEDLINIILSGIQENSFSIEEVESAVNGMINMDGTTGPHWSMEQTNEVYDAEDLEYDRYDWHYILNMMYSDYCDIFKDDTKIYIRLAKNWLDDKDVKPFKAKRYYNYIVLGK